MSWTSRKITEYPGCEARPQPLPEDEKYEVPDLDALATKRTFGPECRSLIDRWTEANSAFEKWAWIETYSIRDKIWEGKPDMTERDLIIFFNFVRI